MRSRDLLLVLLPVLALAVGACSGGEEAGPVGTWRAVADTMGVEPSVLYEFRPDHTVVLDIRAQNTETRGTWVRGQGRQFRVQFGEDSYFPGRELEGRLLAPDSLMLEIRGTERIFVPHDTAGSE